jgi:leucyl-tRNA synthetase
MTNTFTDIDKKWQTKWQESNIFKASENNNKKFLLC